MKLRKGDEIRHGGEVRAIGEAGEFEGYACTFNSVDSYNSVFLPGCFKRTLKERSGKIKVLWDHVDLIGKPISLREDERGLFVHGKLTLEVTKASECYALLRDGACDTMSFAFNVPQGGDYYKDGVRYIKEVKLFEVSPVVFASNEDSKIVNVRNMDFNETLSDIELSQKRDVLITALLKTLNDVWWNRGGHEVNVESVSELSEKAITNFNVAYNDFIAAWFADTRQTYPAANEMTRSLAALCIERRQTLEQIAASSSLTLDELLDIRDGKTIINGLKLAELSTELMQAHQQQRGATIETLCNEIRDGGPLDEGQQSRILALISRTDAGHDDVNTLEDTLATITQFRKQLSR